jgi:hypothetical protein
MCTKERWNEVASFEVWDQTSHFFLCEFAGDGAGIGPERDDVGGVLGAVVFTVEEVVA